MRVYKYKSAKGVTSFSDIEPLNTDFKEVRVGCYACDLDSHIDWHNAKLYLRQYHQDILAAARRHNVEPAFIRAIIHAESHFNVNAISKQGAQGLMQLMPDTAKALGVNNAFIAKQNINGGVKHLSTLLKKYQGDKRLVTAAYNAGEGAVKKYAGIPPFAETKVYVERVAILHKRYKKAISL
ncbi:MAG: lytic transglycosylase domain-containing protein [Colwellia sp.]|nr:lytic transglycosylase domain-containing protein [Colwellia sp.]MCW8865264.1 lytic transglycosylase domain-containing protein [Colwellia sp.]MCW9082692.1 lytic transglycosylase domain-containing protein [Colwellia sp.]